MNIRLFDRLTAKSTKRSPSFLRSIVSGSFFKVSDLKGNTSISDIQTKIETMRALAKDSQIASALSYYATDATTVNSDGQIIWATSEIKEVAEIINSLFKRWNINAYVRDHILELATIGNLYIPTTGMYKDNMVKQGIALDNNTIVDSDFDIIPSYKIAPEDVVHVWYQGTPYGYIYQPSDDVKTYTTYPESAIIHFSLGGLLGEYTLDTLQADGSVKTWDIQFAEPLMSNAVSPTQTLSLLEDAILLSSLIRTVRFVNVDCQNAEEDETRSILQEIKDSIEQQLSLNTSTGDAQSFVNPQSPNNLIYLPKVDGQDAISITDLNMSDVNDADSKLLDYYQNKKLSVLGVPKEALNYSSNEGMGGAGSVLSQRSAIYANILTRLETAYKAGWTKALNIYFTERGMSGYADKFELHMNPIITQLSTLQAEKRDSALSQASNFVSLLSDINVTDRDAFVSGLSEILSDVFPKVGSDIPEWNMKTNDVEESGGAGGFGGGL